MARIKPQALLQQSKKKKGASRISISTIIFFSLMLVVLVFLGLSTYRHLSHRSVNPAEHGSIMGRKELIDLKKTDVPRYAVLKTSKGSVTVELFKESSPEIVDDFIELCQKGHFKGMQFHRVIKNYVIQGGDVHSLGDPAEWASRGKHYNQLDKSMKHEAFMLGTSKVKPDNRGFEIFITTAPIPDLNEKLSVFGKVVKGEEVVQEIEEVDTDNHYQPKTPIVIFDVVLEQKA